MKLDLINARTEEQKTGQRCWQFLLYMNTQPVTFTALRKKQKIKCIASGNR